LVFRWSNGEQLNKRTIYEFELKQYKTKYEDYVKALEEAILKRYPENYIPIVPVSSGLDSGSIACCLHKHNKKAVYVSFMKNEDNDIIK
jgi:asparagine synthetase B (glutamine-hydrolysing)